MPNDSDLAGDSRYSGPILPNQHVFTPRHSAFWQTLVRFEVEKLTPWLGLRNSIGVAIPLLLGYGVHSISAGLIMGAGALNVCFSDGDDAYIVRSRRMLLATVLVALAVILGATAGHSHLAITLLTIAWAFVAGMLVCIGPTPGDMGVVSLVTFIVFGGQPMNPHQAVQAALLAGLGGLIQTALALTSWPVRRYRPERRALRDLFRELAQIAHARVNSSEAPPASAQTTYARLALSSLNADHSFDSERYLSLMNQAERMRLSLFALARLRRRLAREERGSACAIDIDEVFEISALLFETVAESLLTGQPSRTAAANLQRLTQIAERLHSHSFVPATGNPADLSIAALRIDARSQVDALAGQHRAAIELSAWSTPTGEAAFAEREARRRWNLRLAGVRATLRANLTLASTTFRHAIRLAVCLGVGDLLSFSAGFGRSYWLPMTIAIVLKPDFTATFSRGVLRLAGTFAGLVFTTLLLRVLPEGAGFHLAAITLAVFILRAVGAANYGILVATVTALVVLLIGLSGVPAHVLVVDRAWNTLAGGILCILVYIVWPTWERAHISDVIANLLDGYRDYFRALRDSYVAQERTVTGKVDRARLAARLARSNLEGSFDRLRAEPGTPPDRVALLASILASSHRVVYALMALEAGLMNSAAAPPRPEFLTFANHVELTLYYIAAALRGSPISVSELPDLRADHNALTHSGDSLTERYAMVNIETDRLTNSLNTLTEQIFFWLANSPTHVR